MNIGRAEITSLRLTIARLQKSNAELQAQCDSWRLAFEELNAHENIRSSSTEDLRTQEQPVPDTPT